MSAVPSQSSSRAPRRSAPARPRSVSKTSDRVAAAIETIDGLFDHAGLTRSLRGAGGSYSHRQQLDRSAPEELHRPAPEPRVAANGVQWLPVPGWNLPWLMAGFSTRLGGKSRVYCPEGAPGELNLGFTAQDSREAVVANRRLLAEAVSDDAETPIVTVRQIHSNRVVTIAGPDNAAPTRADGLFTAQPGLLLGVLTADCIPVLVADRKRRVVGAFHAGWRGTVKRIVETGVGRMRLEYGCRPQDLVAAIGPGIGPCCYAVGDEVFTEFESQFVYARALFHEVYDSDPIRTRYPMLFLTQRAPGHSPIGPSLHVDLVEANRRQLLDAGVPARAIQLTGGCTNCQTGLFFSHRASRGYAGRMMSVIGIRVR